MNNVALQSQSTPVFRTSRLTCRPVTAEDAAFYVSLFGLPQITAHRPGARPLSGNESLGSHARDMAHWDRHGFGRWILMHAGRPVGLGGLTLRFGYEGLNLSYHILPELWGQGLASEFVRAAVDHARDTLKEEQVFGLVRPSNSASIRVLEKAGFKEVDTVMQSGAPMLHLRLKIW